MSFKCITTINLLTKTNPFPDKSGFSPSKGEFMKINNNLLAQRGHNSYLLELRELSRLNRQNPTKAESLIWNIILRKKYLGYKFLRQKPLNQFILDFYCSKLLLDIEIDGDYHLNQKNHDDGRDKILSSLGIKTIRYNNDEVLMTLNTVIEDLKVQINNRQNEI